jgi:Mlc titration factor MtfA (ptsG expression regulator)
MLRALRRYLALRRIGDPPPLWRLVTEALPALDHLDAEQRTRLYRLAVLFLREKTVEPVEEGINLDEAALLRLAALACLPILELGLDWYDGFHSVVIYPAEFFPEREFVDEHGVTHVVREELRGEAWERGPVILSLLDFSEPSAEDGTNLVLHEFAHKLDMDNGFANGMPPLHRDMSLSAWTQDLSAAYEDLCSRVDAGEAVAVDPYAATDPAEFFAVMTEHFFEDPQLLNESYPSVYAQLRRFYRQDPLSR